MARKRVNIGRKKAEHIMMRLLEIQKAAAMKHASFHDICTTAGEDLPIRKESQVTDFIKDRTRLYRESWILRPVGDLLSILMKELGIEED